MNNYYWLHESPFKEGKELRINPFIHLLRVKNIHLINLECLDLAICNWKGWKRSYDNKEKTILPPEITTIIAKHFFRLLNPSLKKEEMEDLLFLWKNYECVAIHSNEVKKWYLQAFFLGKEVSMLEKEEVKKNNGLTTNKKEIKVLNQKKEELLKNCREVYNNQLQEKQRKVEKIWKNRLEKIRKHLETVDNQELSSLEILKRFNEEQKIYQEWSPYNKDYEKRGRKLEIVSNELKKIYSQHWRTKEEDYQKIIQNLTNEKESLEKSVEPLKKQIAEKDQTIELREGAVNSYKRWAEQLKEKLKDEKDDKQKWLIEKQKMGDENRTLKDSIKKANNIDNPQENKLLKDTIQSLTFANIGLNQKNTTLKFLAFFSFLALLSLGIFSWIKIRTKKVKKSLEI